jgi:RNA polymerase sigma-70 factor (ECF subfamily)
LTIPSDRELIQAVFAGDKAAFAGLYDRYAALIRAICYDTTRNLADAQDLAQEVLTRAYEKLGSLRDPDRFGKWIVGIARLRCREWQRQRLRSQNQNIALRNAQPAAPDPIDDSRIELLRKMITTLPPKERLALHAFYLQGKSADNARRIIGLSRSGFYRLLERARRRLRQLLIREQENIP